MKTIVFLKASGRSMSTTIEAETNEEACQKAFNLEFNSMDRHIEITAIRFPQERIMPWNSTAAHYCFGKGRCTIAYFIEWCKAPIEYVNENGPIPAEPVMFVSSVLNLTNPTHQLIVAEQEKALRREEFEMSRHRLMAATRRIQEIKTTIHFATKQSSHA